MRSAYLRTLLRSSLVFWLLSVAVFFIGRVVLFSAFIDETVKQNYANDLSALFLKGLQFDIKAASIMTAVLVVPGLLCLLARKAMTVYRYCLPKLLTAFLVIALAATGEVSLTHKIAVLAMVGLLMTIAVYGLIALIIRLDDMGLSLARGRSGWRQRLGYTMAQAAPRILKALGPIGIVAMLMVAGGIFSHLLHLEFQSGFFLALVTDVCVGLIAGLILYLAVQLVLWLRQRF